MQDINYSLICAVRDGRLERARELIDSYGLSYSPGWSEGYVLLRDAIGNKHSAIAKLLLTSGSKVNSKSIMPSNTPLHFAAINGDLDIVEMIVDKGGNVNAKNKDGRTPLHNAIENKKEEITELLLRYGADVNDTDKYDKSPLQFAVQRGCLQIVEHLLNYGANVNCVDWSTSKSYAPLHFAVEKGSHEIVTLLLSRGANVDIEGEDTVTPLHIAANKGYVHIAEDLLEHGACIHSSTLKEGFTPLHFATKAGHVAFVNLLLQHGAKVDDQDKDGKTILHLAVEKRNVMIVKDVLKYSPDINNEGNRSALKTAVYGYRIGYKNIVETLLEYGFSVNPDDANNPVLLHAAIEKGYLKIVEDLLKHGADVNTLLNSSSVKSFTPLHTAAKNKQESVAKLLIRYGADVNAQDKTGKSPIFYAIESADLKITKLLITNEANVKDYPELLFTSVKNECIEIVESLLQHGADVNARDKDGRTALHFTASRRLEDSSRFLTNEKLHNINNKKEIAKLLLSRGANVNAQTKNGKTTLHEATENGYAGVVEALLEYNAEINFGEKMTACNLSAQNGDEKICTILLNKGANIDAKLKDSTTALFIAIQKGHNDVVKVLLEYGAEVDSKIKNNLTPLHWAVRNGYQDIIETLLKRGADINSRDEFGRTPLHIACTSKQGSVNVVETLLEYGADINIVDADNCTPLNYALKAMRTYRPSYQESYDDDDDDYYYCRGLNLYEGNAEDLKRHIVKMKTANLYVSEENLLSVDYWYEMRYFQNECEKEIASMKSEKIKNANISFYDILAKSVSSLAIYMRNENIVETLKSDDYETKFTIYACLIKNHFRKAMKRKELLEQGIDIFRFVFNEFPQLPHHCTEKIFSYLSDEDLKNFNGCGSRNTGMGQL